MAMLDPDELSDAIVISLRSATALVSLFGGDSNNIFARKLDYTESVAVNIEGELQEQPNNTAMVFWKGTRTGNFGKMEAIKHDFGIAIKPSGRPAAAFKAIREAECTDPEIRKFKHLQVDTQVFPPENFTCIPASTFVAQGYGLYDASIITFTLTERGVDS